MGKKGFFYLFVCLFVCLFCCVFLVLLAYAYVVEIVYID